MQFKKAPTESKDRRRVELDQEPANVTRAGVQGKAKWTPALKKDDPAQIHLSER